MGEKRAVITGMGAISCIGNTLDEISNSLKKVFLAYQEMRNMMLWVLEAKFQVP